jgi:hypothetical protein
MRGKDGKSGTEAVKNSVDRSPLSPTAGENVTASIFNVICRTGKAGGGGRQHAAAACDEKGDAALLTALFSMPWIQASTENGQARASGEAHTPLFSRSFSSPISHAKTRNIPPTISTTYPTPLPKPLDNRNILKPEGLSGQKPGGLFVYCAGFWPETHRH